MSNNASVPSEEGGAGNGTAKESGVKQALDMAKKVAKEAAVITQEVAVAAKDGAVFVSEKSIVLGNKVGIPPWGIYLILAAVVSVILIGSVVMCKRMVKKKGKKGKDEENEEIDMAELAENEEGEKEGEDDGDGCPGRLTYKISYDFTLMTLTVTVIKAEELTAMDSGGTSDPYCKVFLLPPDKKHKFETKVHRCNLNPEFNETFVFKNIPFADLMPKTLVFIVNDYDRFGKHDPIGEIKIQLCTLDFEKQDVVETKNLLPVEDTSKRLGDLCFSLRYAPNTGKFTIAIIEAKNLKQMDLGGLADPFAKIYLMQNGKRISKKKTSVKKCTLNPYYNESFVFEVPQSDIAKTQVIITMFDYDLIGGCDPIGRAIVGHGATGVGFKHWKDMIDTPRRPIVQWHTLEAVEEK